MAERILGKDQIFQGWGVGQSSRVIGTLLEELECKGALKDVKKWIAQHHTSANDRYFYSARKINQLALLKKEGWKRFEFVFRLCFIACIGSAIAVYWRTRPYFAELAHSKK